MASPNNRFSLSAAHLRSGLPIAILVALAATFSAAAAPNDLPTGAQDPDALTCSAPGVVPLAKAVGWKICVQNSIVATFNETGRLSPNGPVIRAYSDLPISQNLTGTGDPDAVTCWEGERQRTASRTRGPIACARNDFWAKLDARGCILSPDARRIIRSGTTKNLDPLACTNVPGRNGRLPPLFF